MRPHPRNRKTVKWGGAAVSVVLVVVWVGSGWFAVEWHAANGAGLAFDQGRLYVGQTGFFLPPGGLSTRSCPILLGFSLEWWFYWQSSPTSWTFGTPLWPLVIPAICSTAAAWRLDTLARRRARVGRCPKCNYDRAGLPSGAVCPECGAAA